MACNIGFTDFRGHESAPGQGLTSLVMRGTATECSLVCVALKQTQPTDFQTAERCVDVINGAWEVTFSVVTDFPAGTFRCGPGNKVVPQVRCTADPNCVMTNFQNFNGATIVCDDCPQLDFSNASVSIGGCNPDGTRTVTFNGTVSSSTGAATAVTHIEVVASGAPSIVLGNSAPTIGAAGSVPLLAYSINLASGSYIARLRVDSPVGCAALEVPFTIDACALPVVCPSGESPRRLEIATHRVREV